MIEYKVIKLNEIKTCQYDIQKHIEFQKLLDKYYYNNVNESSDTCHIAISDNEVIAAMIVINRRMYFKTKAISCAIMSEIVCLKNDEQVANELVSFALKTIEKGFAKITIIFKEHETYSRFGGEVLPLNMKCCDISTIQINDKDYEEYYLREISYDSDVVMLEAMHNGCAAKQDCMFIRKTPQYWKEFLQKRFKNNAFVLCNMLGTPVAFICIEKEGDKLLVKEYISLLDYSDVFDVALYKWIETKGLLLEQIEMYAFINTNLKVIEKYQNNQVMVIYNEESFVKEFNSVHFALPFIEFFSEKI